MEVRIIFNDGTSVVAEQNANTYITAAQPAFPEDLSVVTVENDDQSQVLHNVKVQECASIDGRYWFGLIEESEMERENRLLREQIESLNNGQNDLISVLHTMMGVNTNE